MRNTHYHKMCHALPTLIGELALQLIKNNPLDRDKVLFGIFGIHDIAKIPDEIMDDFFENFGKYKKEAALVVKQYFQEIVPDWFNPPHPNFDFRYEMDIIMYHLFEKESTYLDLPFRLRHLDEYDNYENFDNGNIVLINIFSLWLDNIINNSTIEGYNECFSKGIDHIKKLERMEEEELQRRYGSDPYSDYDDLDEDHNGEKVDEEAISWQDLYEYNENH